VGDEPRSLAARARGRHPLPGAARPCEGGRHARGAWAFARPARARARPGARAAPEL